jgi:hypothetical protein
MVSVTVTGYPDWARNYCSDSSTRTHLEEIAAQIGGGLQIAAYHREYYNQGINPWYRLEPTPPGYRWTTLSPTTIRGHITDHPLWVEKDLTRFNLLEVPVEPIGYLGTQKMLVKGTLPLTPKENQYHVVACTWVSDDSLEETQHRFPNVGTLSKSAQLLINTSLGALGADGGELHGLTLGDLAQVASCTETTIFKTPGRGPYAGWELKRLQCHLPDGSEQIVYSTSVGYSEGYAYDLYKEFPAVQRLRELQLYQFADNSWSGWYFGDAVGEDWEVVLRPEEAMAIQKIQWGGLRPPIPELLTELNLVAVERASQIVSARLEINRLWHGEYREKYACARYGVEAPENDNCPVQARFRAARKQLKMLELQCRKEFHGWRSYGYENFQLTLPELRDLRNQVGDNGLICWLRCS